MNEIKLSAIDNLIKLSLELLNASQGAFLSADEETKTLKFEVVSLKHGTAEALRRISDRLIGNTVAYGVGLTGKAAELRQAQFATRIDNADMSHVGGDGTPNAVMAVPVVVADRLLGVLTAVRFDRELAFSEEDVRRYSMAAKVASGIIE